ncbi:MAG: MFS transporter [Pseudomonadota bacterium]
MEDRLPAYTLFGGILAAAGLPIYIYAPPYYAENYGVTLTGIAAVLFWLRLFDAVQDPVLGWISERLGRHRGLGVAIGALILAASMIGLFSVPPPIAPLAWFAITITGLFSAFSFLTINFYAQGVSKALTLRGSHMRLAAWRETGSLLGVCIAAVAPSLLLGIIDSPYSGFAWGFSGFVLIAVMAMWPEWKPTKIETEKTPIRTIWADGQARRLLILALINATPLAVSSTLFLFFVEDRLAAPGWEGPLLVLFFLSGAVAAPFWSRAASRFGPKRALLFAMVLAVITFGFAVLLRDGDVMLFAIICVASGATIGADLTLMPALFAKRMGEISPNGGQGFGLWSLVNKMSLAFAAIALLPLLEASGFDASAQTQPHVALTTLTILYALVPLALKLFAIALLVATKLGND